MTYELIGLLRGRHAFNSRPDVNSLGTFFVSFTEDQDLEAKIARAVVAHERVALIGPSGGGKSSVLQYVLRADRGERPFAAIWVSVLYEDDLTLTDPRRFAQTLAVTLVDQARTAELLLERQQSEDLLREAGDRIALPSMSIARKGGLGVSLWMLRAQLAAEITRTLGAVDLARPAAELIGAVDEVITAIRAEGYEPVIVIDDSDRWFNLPGLSDKSALVDRFFGAVVPMLAQRGVGLVIAAHPSYEDKPGYRHAREQGEVDTEIRVPEFANVEGLRGVLDRRVERVSPEHCAGDVLTDDAIERLFAYYKHVSHGNMRKTLQVTHSALVAAFDHGEETVALQYVEGTITGDNPG
jgi:hypothetical protein